MTRRDELLKLAGEFAILSAHAHREVIKLFTAYDHDCHYVRKIRERADGAVSECAELIDKLEGGK